MTYFDSPHAYTGEEIALSQTIAGQIAFAIGRKRADEKLRHSEERFRELSETLETEVRKRTQELEDRNAEILDRNAEILSQLLARLSKTIRTTSYLLYPPMLDDIGLPVSLMCYRT